jgi:hypothetical protein
MRMIRFVVLAWMLLLAAPSIAQEFRSTVTVVTSGTSLAFAVTISNASTTPRLIKSVKLSLLPVAMQFDVAGTATPAATFAPNVAANGDSILSNTLTITPAALLAPGQSLTTANGDIDPSTGLTGIAADITYDDNTVVSGALAASGTTWTATLVKSAVPTYSINLSWQAPTQNTDNSPYTNPGGYKVYWGTAAGSYSNSVVITNPATLNYRVDQLPTGVYFLTASAINTAGVESALATPVQGIASPKPAALPALAPGALVVGPEGTAYVIFQTRDSGALVPTGTVPVGTACNGAIGFRDVQHGDMYVVPKALVQFSGDADAELVFAKCQ